MSSLIATRLVRRLTIRWRSPQASISASSLFSSPRAARRSSKSPIFSRPNSAPSGSGDG